MCTTCIDGRGCSKQLLNNAQLCILTRNCPFLNLNFNCSNLLVMRNLQEQVKKALFDQTLFWFFTFWINYSSNLKIFVNSGPLASNFKSFSRSLEHFFLTVGQNNFGNKIPFIRQYLAKMYFVCAMHDHYDQKVTKSCTLKT